MTEVGRLTDELMLSSTTHKCLPDTIDPRERKE